MNTLNSTNVHPAVIIKEFVFNYKQNIIISDVLEKIVASDTKVFGVTGALFLPIEVDD